MASKKGKPARKKFKKISFKISSTERNRIEYCSRLENTTMNKFIKAAIREKAARYQERIEEQEKNQVSENQLSLFSTDNSGEQTSILDLD
ncbi:MAG: hypothetical protein R6T91_06775 [Bacteroidales bacterium]